LASSTADALVSVLLLVVPLLPVALVLVVALVLLVALVVLLEVASAGGGGGGGGMRPVAPVASLPALPSLPCAACIIWSRKLLSSSLDRLPSPLVSIALNSDCRSLLASVLVVASVLVLLVLLVVLAVVVVPPERPNSDADSAPSPSVSSAAIGSLRWPIDAVLRCTSNCAGGGGGPDDWVPLVAELLSLPVAKVNASLPLLAEVALDDVDDALRAACCCCARRCIKVAMLLPLLTDDIELMMKILSCGRCRANHRTNGPAQAVGHKPAMTVSGLCVKLEGRG